MKPQAIHHPIRFGNAALGQRSHEPIIAEGVLKPSNSMAAMITGPRDRTVPDEFDLDDIWGHRQ